MGFIQRQPPVTYQNKGFARGGFASGGSTANITVANSAIPALTSDEVNAFPTMGSAAAIPAVSTAPQPYSSSIGQVPMSALSGGAGSNGIIAAVNNQGVPQGQPGMPTSIPNMAFAPPVASVPAPVSTTAAPSTPSSLVPNQPLGGSQFPMNSGITGVAPTLARGGKTKKMADGGIPTSEAMDPWYARQEERGMLHPEGLITSTGAGRTDVHNITLPAGSYVIPADVVSGLGEGNSLSGSSVIDKMMHSNPYGIQGGTRHGNMGPPRAPRPMTEPTDSFKLESAGGRTAKKQDGAVGIIAAGGEHVLYPGTIIEKFGSLSKGHKILDKWVLKTRAKTIQEMRKLKPPKK